MAQPEPNLQLRPAFDSDTNPSLVLNQTSATTSWELRRHREAARRLAEWPTWQMDRSWPNRPLIGDQRETECEPILAKRSEFAAVRVASIMLTGALLALLAVGVAMGVI